ncbi:unnamed protein product [Discula destructiva]
MPSRAGPPPLLLTKRLTAFLHLNLTSTITSLLLLTPDGKLLAYASNPPTPVTTLRTHATVAASLYAIHSAGTDLNTVEASIPGRPRASHYDYHHRPHQQQDDNDDADALNPPRQSPLAVTIQLETGTVLVIRRLQCGMLFVCMGPPPEPTPNTTTTNTTTSSTTAQHNTAAGGAANIQPLAGAITSTATDHGVRTPSTSPPPPPPHGFGSPSEVGSILSTATGQTTASSIMFGAGTAGVMATRRHVEELARWLDEKLGPLDIPPNGFGGPV